MLSFNLKFGCCNFRNNYAIIIVVVQHKKMSWALVVLMLIVKWLQNLYNKFFLGLWLGERSVFWSPTILIYDNTEIAYHFVIFHFMSPPIY